MPNNTPKALIYCRVSSQKQVNEGHGNDSQEKRCRDRAAIKGIPVAKVFPDDGISGSLFDRPAMTRLLNYIDDHPHEDYVVIFDDLSRFARDVGVHIKLKAEFYSRGVRLECLNFNFDDSEESEFAELVLAAGNQYQRKANRRQVIQKQKARLEKGYWPFCQPIGLKNIKDPIHGKILTPQEPYATIFKEAIEMFRDELLLTPEDVRLFIAERYKQQCINRKISLNGTKYILTRILYAGYIEYSKWKIPLMKAKHEGFISLETFNIVQARLHRRSKPWDKRKDYNTTFPLRPYVLCDFCGKPLTATCTTKPREGKVYPNYFCRNKQCPRVWDVIKKAKIEGEFEELLSKTKLDSTVIDLANEIFNKVWEAEKEKNVLAQSNRLREKEQAEAKIKNYVERIGKAEDESLVEVYEKEIKSLTDFVKELELEIYTDKYSQKSFRKASDVVFGTLKKPLEMWQSESFEDKRTILFMYFGDQLRYNHEKGFGTSQLARINKLIEDVTNPLNPDVEMWSSELQSKKTSQKHLQA